MQLIAEFEVASTVEIPGETKFARLRRIATEHCRPLVKVTTWYVPNGSEMAVSKNPLSLREASDLMLSRLSPVVIIALVASMGVGVNVT